MDKQIFQRIKNEERIEVSFLKKIINNSDIGIKTSRAELKAESIVDGLGVSSFNNYYFVWNSLGIIIETKGFVNIDPEFFDWAVWVAGK